MTRVRIDGIVKRFGEASALSGVSLELPPGELFTLLGPSGCGKTTLLRIVAGLLAQDAGSVAFDGVPVDSVPPYRRNIGVVFQSYAIFPHLTVRQNIAYGLRARRMDSERAAAKVVEAARMVQMEPLLDRMPAALSGGQQQRVVLARALVIEPRLLLMDEPLSNLDARLRVEMRTVIRRLQRALGITTLYVTHDQEEALAISDTIAVMDRGQVLQTGPPWALYRRAAGPLRRGVPRGDERLRGPAGECGRGGGRRRGGDRLRRVVGGRGGRLGRRSGAGVARDPAGIAQGRAAAGRRGPLEPGGGDGDGGRLSRGRGAVPGRRRARGLADGGGARPGFRDPSTGRGRPCASGATRPRSGSWRRIRERAGSSARPRGRAATPTAGGS